MNPIEVLNAEAAKPEVLYTQSTDLSRQIQTILQGCAESNHDHAKVPGEFAIKAIPVQLEEEAEKSDI